MEELSTWKSAAAPPCVLQGSVKGSTTPCASSIPPCRRLLLVAHRVHPASIDHAGFPMVLPQRPPQRSPLTIQPSGMASALTTLALASGSNLSAITTSVGSSSCRTNNDTESRLRQAAGDTTISQQFVYHSCQPAVTSVTPTGA